MPSPFAATPIVEDPSSSNERPGSLGESATSKIGRGPAAAQAEDSEALNEARERILQSSVQSLGLKYILPPSNGMLVLIASVMTPSHAGGINWPIQLIHNCLCLEKETEFEENIAFQSLRTLSPFRRSRDLRLTYHLGLLLRPCRLDVEWHIQASWDSFSTRQTMLQVKQQMQPSLCAL